MKLTLVNFQSDEEINLDSDNPVIIGRGSLFGCFDKKVSRNHGKVQLTPDGNVQLIALHSNPCFIMKNGMPPVIQLTKDQDKILSNGDYIGLLPDSFWFKIVVNKDEDTNTPISFSINSTDTKTVIENDNVVEENAGQVINAKTASDESGSSPSEKEIPEEPVFDSDKNANEKGDPVNQSDLLCERLKALEKTKKLPLHMYDIDDFPEESCDSYQEETLITLETKERNSSEFIKNSEEKQNCSDKSEPTSVNVTDMDSLPLVRSINHSSKELQKDPNDCEVNMNIDVSSKTHTSQSSEEITVMENTDGNNSLESLNPQKRPLCLYEEHCYRKNEQHKRDFSHPGDPDFLPYKDRPICQYGSSCYRHSKSHQVEYQHPKKRSSTKPGPSSLRDSSESKRRKKETKYRDTSDEDDYDLEDPFINDGSSDEFVPTGSESGEDWY